MEAQESLATDDDIERLAGELASAAAISTQQARHVLELLHIDWLNGNFQELLKLSTTGSADESSGIAQSAAREFVEAARRTPLSLATVRIAIKPPRQAGLVV